MLVLFMRAQLYMTYIFPIGSFVSTILHSSTLDGMMISLMGSFCIWMAGVWATKGQCLYKK